MSSQNISGIAQSNYRQVRLTITQELTGVLSYRVLAKRLEDGWQERHVIASGSLGPVGGITSMEDAFNAVFEVARAQFVPGIG